MDLYQKLIDSALGSGGGGGGGSSYTLITSGEYTVSTTSTSETDVVVLKCGADAWTKDCVIYVRIYDKAGSRNGYFVESNAYAVNTQVANGYTSSFTAWGYCNVYRASDGEFKRIAGSYGVYPSTIRSNGEIPIKTKYQSGQVGTIDGTYVIEVYRLDFPNGISPFNR